MRWVWEGSFLSRLAEAETLAERSFSKSVSLCTFASETRAERSFSRSFSPHMSCLERLLAHVTSRNLREMATRGGPGALVRARYQPKPARNGHAGGPGAPVRTRYQPKPARNGLFGHHGAERRILKSFSQHTFPPGTCTERSSSKSFSPRRFRLRQAMPKRNLPRHHAGNPLPS